MLEVRLYRCVIHVWKFGDNTISYVLVVNPQACTSFYKSPTIQNRTGKLGPLRIVGSENAVKAA